MKTIEKHQCPNCWGYQTYEESQATQECKVNK